MQSLSPLIEETIGNDNLPKPPPNPNIRSNRIPSTSELALLRRISGQNRKAIEQLDNELSSARQEYREIHTLYQVTMEEIRSMESKLFATHQSITARVKQRQILETQNEEINGIIHPIRRCPEDILQVIFEWAVEFAVQAGTKRCRGPFRVSHVCRIWRTIALRTASLWSYVKFWAGRSSDTAQQVMECIAPRLGTVAPDIVINIPRNITASNFLPACLNVFTRIRSLRLLTDRVNDIKKCIAFGFGTLRVERVIFEPTKFDKDHPLDFSCFLKAFPTSTFLELNLPFGTNDTVILDQGTFSSLRSLTLQNLTSFTSFPKLSHLVNLEKLDLKSVYTELGNIVDRVKCHNLLEITLKGSDPGFLELLDTPRIQKLRWDWEDEDEDDDDDEDGDEDEEEDGDMPKQVIDYILRHPSIVHFEGWLGKNPFSQVMPFSSQLEYLDICRSEFRSSVLSVIYKSPKSHG